ncbi:MAG: glutamine--fructose-6-phosphate transaminase (isomerizing) [Oliverpabstia intestinalis]|uniref:Glutamine--fructose-6-phosphate aminotransferase [isomerizing] n=1 Tax=Oliverpabstia intestinalis TaxID=2606633 RepID=A0A7X2P0R6_9FIRM|nr:glutamine--fructose-6-phosphate transaminase (isomerizing) [Oliverpabstia intestinalis]MCF2542849.1 glutamine--fructose-6-phosphate transaminase (isomerizing) [Blautia producta]MEE1180417.1 glutamine--fructose-6-phosphate transaminase (isomerizing) [Lachnospiraceae bacterium]MDD6412032.1 glutamine--fructose-6-phosphate transaminase (isomerizing) [Oliverpabstia intestinalis]MDY5790495.1 glutamine--fructose-6-phosphate transaminase (isomerizing) [Oliverpabstia intestinalis]MST65326.1 glutamin
MCGIVGYTGMHSAAPVLLDGLSKLEYRGYDSAGIAVRDGEKQAEVIKAKGRLKKLIEKTNGGDSVPGTCGIGHTRWATHGEPSENNAHPHTSDDGNVVAVHNGIIENYQELKDKLIRNGYTFYSETDTEVAVKLVDYYYKKYEGTPVDALTHAMVRIRGSYALAIMFKEYPEEIYVARKDSPMILGVENGESFIASDVPAILKYTRNVYYIGNLEMARVRKGEITFFNLDGDEVEKQPKVIEWDAEAAEKAGFEHFMIKEIHEQPKAVADTLNSVLHDGVIDLSDVGLSEEEIKNISQIYIVACGSAYHVGMAAQYVLEDLARIPVRVELASEFRYRKPLLDKNGLAIIISQSGETADSLAALREAKSKGVRTLGIVNVIGSSIAREADNVFYTLAGPEISVATTKAYSTQLIASYLLAIQFAKVREEITQEQYDGLIAELQTLPEKIQKIIDDKERLQWFAAKQVNAKDIFFIGRGIDYAISMEGSLKMKEISYIHSEAYAAGELKHGTISLIEDGTLVIGCLTQPALYEKTVSNMVECKSRGAYLMGLTTYGNYNIEDTADFVTYIPKTDPHFATSLAVIPLQLMGYYVSVAKGLDVDKPRNLAKSVTVE